MRAIYCFFREAFEYFDIFFETSALFFPLDYILEIVYSSFLALLYVCEDFSMSRCLSDKEIEMLFSETGSKLKTIKHRQHLRVCDRCAGRLAQFRLANKAGNSSGSESASRERIIIPTKSALEPNVEIGDFRIERRLGDGGMGVVYEAYQKSLNRRVALKVLGGSLLTSKSAVERFGREARASAKLRHPNIVSIYEEGIEEDICYYAMELVEGKSVSELIEEFREEKNENDDLSKTKTSWILDTASLAEKKPEKGYGTREHFNKIALMVSEAADALEYAHQNSVIHRDIKPSNLMISNGGRLKITDFGIARVEDDNAMTVTGTFLGSPLYMSPEQLKENRDIDHRTDIYSLGVTLYELLTLKPLFEGLTTHEQAITHILNKIPAAPRSVNEKIPVDLETICCKAIETQPERRYQSAGEFAEDLRRFVEGKVIKAKPAGTVDKLSKFFKRHKTASILTCCIVIAASLAALLEWRNMQDRRVEKMIPRVTQLTEQKEFYDAFVQAKAVESIKPDNPILKDFWPKLSRAYSVNSEPAGADIYIKNYYNEDTEWFRLGRTPIDEVWVPFGTNTWKVEKKGFEGKLFALTNWYIPDDGLREVKKKTQTFILQEAGKYPEDMVWIPPSDLSRNLLHNDVEVENSPAFLIDKFEVTNKQFKEFVDAGGYANVKYWQEPFVKDGKLLSWKEATRKFVDSTEMLGPSTWENGTYPDGKGDYPVSGVSWYEAAACANFLDKDLPTAFHWYWAAISRDSHFRIVQQSNFGDSTDPAGTNKGMGRSGIYDCAGNVREWCYNAVEKSNGSRCILGGAFGDPSYLFWDTVFTSAWDRDARNGFRCVRYLGGKDKVPEVAFDMLLNKGRRMRDFTPKSMETVQNCIDTLYQYDKTPLNVKVESSEDNEHCRVERVSYDASYPGRITAILLLPKNVPKPYKTCVWFPGSNAVRTAWKGWENESELNLLVKSGRAVLVPFYQGTFNRRIENNRLYQTTLFARDLNVQRALDLRRSIDFIESRKELDCKSIAYVGFSWGASIGPVMMAVEDRIKTGVYVLGGMCGCDRHPAYDTANFTRFVKAPVIMFNGRDDTIHTYESQRYIFNTLATDAKDKKHVLYPSGHHIPWEYKDEYQKTLLDWLDKYQGGTEGRK